MPEEKVPSLLKAYNLDPQAVISQLFDIENVVVGIVYNSPNPLVLNWIRTVFIQKMYDNVVDNLHYNELLAKYYGHGDTQQKINSALKDIVKHSEESPNSKSAYLTKLFDDIITKKGVKIESPSHVKLIPSFHYFDKVVAELVSMELLLSRRSTYKHAETVFYPNGLFFKKWLENRKQYVNNLSSVFSHPEYSFYDLNKHALLLEIRKLESVISSNPNKKILDTRYTAFNLTDVEGKFLVYLAGLEQRV